MEDIRKALLRGDGTKLSKKEYAFVINLEKNRLFTELVFYTIVSFLVGGFLFFSLAGEIKKYD
jgi:hypothetical protein